MQNRDKRRLINEDEFNENEQRLKEREREKHDKTSTRWQNLSIHCSRIVSIIRQDF